MCSRKKCKTLCILGSIYHKCLFDHEVTTCLLNLTTCLRENERHQQKTDQMAEFGKKPVCRMWDSAEYIIKRSHIELFLSMERRWLWLLTATTWCKFNHSSLFPWDPVNLFPRLVSILTWVYSELPQEFRHRNSAFEKEEFPTGIRLKSKLLEIHYAGQLHPHPSVSLSTSFCVVSSNKNLAESHIPHRDIFRALGN